MPQYELNIDPDALTTQIAALETLRQNLTYSGEVSEAIRTDAQNLAGVLVLLRVIADQAFSVHGIPVHHRTPAELCRLVTEKLSDSTLREVLQKASPPGATYRDAVAQFLAALPPEDSATLVDWARSRPPGDTPVAATPVATIPTKRILPVESNVPASESS